METNDNYRPMIHLLITTIAAVLLVGWGELQSPKTAASTLADEVIFDIPWQAGDLALVDNYIAMHGRRTFSGTRKILTSFVAA